MIEEVRKQVHMGMLTASALYELQREYNALLMVSKSLASIHG